MSDIIVTEITNLTSEELSPIVTQVLGERAYPVGPLSLTKIGRSFGVATAGIYRVAGQAVGASGEQPWSAVAKVLGDPENTIPTLAYHAMRELDVYRSGVFADVCGGVRCARFYVLQPRDSLQILWLEDLSSTPQAPWVPKHFITTARHFGQFNGHWPEESLPAWEWLRSGSMQSRFRGDFLARGLARFPQVHEHPYMRSFVQADMARELMQMWDESIPILALSDTTSKGICHWDCHPKNLFPMQDARDGEYTVAIDWDQVGIGPLGMDVGHMIASPMSWMELPLHEASALVEPVFNAYLDGLHDVGWSGDEERVWLTYLTRLLFEPFRFTTLLVNATEDEDWAKRLAATVGRPLEEIVTHWGKELDFLMGYRDEVTRMANRIKAAS